MKTTYGALALAAAAKLAYAHTTVYAAWINDVDQGLGNSDSGYIRSPPNNNPIKDVTSTDMTCNVNNVETAKTLEVAPGDKFTFEWHHNSRDDSDDIIASSHKGPVMTYMADADKGGNGTGWVKIAADGYSSDGTWAVDTLISNKGKHSITIPDVAPGNYLLRPEVIALHEASNEGGAQFYMECVQVKVTGSGTTSLPEGVALPGAYAADDAGILFNMYGDFSTYPIPGPTVWSGASSGASATGAASVAATSAAASTPVAATSSAAAAVVQSSSAVVQSSTAVAAVATPSASAAAEDDEEYDCDDEDEAEVTSSVVAVAATSAAASTPVTTPAAVVASSAAAAGGNYISTTTETVYVSNIQTATVTVTVGATASSGTVARKFKA